MNTRAVTAKLSFYFFSLERLCLRHWDTGGDTMGGAAAGKQKGALAR